MKICNGNHWKYILMQKDARQKALAESYGWIREGGGAEIVEKIGKERGNGEYINHVEETANMYRYRYETKREGGKAEIHEYQ